MTLKQIRAQRIFTWATEQMEQTIRLQTSEMSEIVSGQRTDFKRFKKQYIERLKRIKFLYNILLGILDKYGIGEPDNMKRFNDITKDFIKFLA